jgi:hypothetical protein
MPLPHFRGPFQIQKMCSSFCCLFVSFTSVFPAASADIAVPPHAPTSTGNVTPEVAPEALSDVLHMPAPSQHMTDTMLATVVTAGGKNARTKLYC